MSESDPTNLFEELRLRGHEELARGDFDTALATFEEALDWAERHGDRDTVHLALCNVGALRVTLGEGAQVLATLKKVLMASSVFENRFLAAYNLSQHYELIEDLEKTLFYGRIALDNARRSTESKWIAKSLNQLANAELGGSHFEEARDYYAEALLELDDGDSCDQAGILSNLGYCQVILGDHSTAFGNFFRSCRMARRLEYVDFLSQIHLDLCYAYLEIERLDRAWQHGLEAMEVAEERGCSKDVKNCLFLLGEVAKLAGESYEAYSYFSRLQREFYPDNGMVSHFLMTNDVRPLVNLRA